MVLDILGRVINCFLLYGCVSTTPSQHWEYGRTLSFWYGKDICIFFLVYFAVSFLLSVWFYSIIVRGFSAVREVERRRYRPHF
uniref:7TM_GPCR_Srx domain-containing protein n=1 Tax=Globodera pallida TaxID=36090 RepID=A0A183CCV2_GLOPA